MTKSYNSCTLLIILFFTGLLLVACSKKSELAGSPYPAASESKISFYGRPNTIYQGAEGDTLEMEVAGLKKLESGYAFLINTVPVQVLRVTDSLIAFKIPQNASTGTVSISTSSGEYYYGPAVTVLGKTTLDPDFNAGSTLPGTQGPIYNIYKDGDKYVMVGYFFNYNSQSFLMGSIAPINLGGAFQSNESKMGASGGGVGTLLPVRVNGSNRYIIGGLFGGYGWLRHQRGTIQNITQLHTNLALDTTVVKLINVDSTGNPQNSRDTVPNFNARFYNGNVIQVFQDPDPTKIIVVGNFDLYERTDYTRSLKNQYFPVFARIKNFARLNLSDIESGSLDTTYNYSFDRLSFRANENLNGSINDAIQLSNKKIVVAGAFTTFNASYQPGAAGTPVPRIMALNATGGVDMGFATAIGSGANGDITKLTYNATTKKMLLTGLFTSFNGTSTPGGVVMLNEDGSVDKTFATKQLEGGFINFAGQLNNGRIIISGTFRKYDGVTRQGFAILNADGSIAIGYNNIGAFGGIIYGLLEPAADKVILNGSFSLFDGKRVGNIVQLKFAP